VRLPFEIVSSDEPLLHAPPHVERAGVFVSPCLPGESGRMFWTRFAGISAGLVQMKEVHSN